MAIRHVLTPEIKINGVSLENIIDCTVSWGEGHAEIRYVPTSLPDYKTGVRYSISVADSVLISELKTVQYSVDSHRGASLLLEFAGDFRSETK